MRRDDYQEAAAALRKAEHAVAFTGAGISVESGIPPFRGENGLWSRYDPTFLDIAFFRRNPEASWKLIREIFYDYFGRARPNLAHRALARLESEGLIKAVITQNIDNLHQEAGARAVIEYHGTSRLLRCDSCGAKFEASDFDLANLPPHCPRCGGVLRPDFVFFGEPIPDEAEKRSWEEIGHADLLLVIGSSGEVISASLLPSTAKQFGATIVEINPKESNFTRMVTDIFLQAPASEALNTLLRELGLAGENEHGGHR